jgi:uncharacterized protein YlxW (UPF0749 family)
MTRRHRSRATLVAVTPGSHARPADDGTPRPPRTKRPRRRWGAWRVGTPLVVLVCGGLFVVSAHNSQGTDLRPGRYTDLASLVGSEARDYQALQQRVKDLNADVDTLTRSVRDTQVQRYQKRIQKLADPAGLVPRTGPGVTVTLSDAPEEVINNTTRDLNYLVVHQQDIQAVVNAMWKAGAEAVTVQGQRVVTTTGIKCEGNAVQLQGVPYSQPYVISAVGDQTELLNEIGNDSYLKVYREQAADPSISVGWDLQLEDSITAPAYDGLLDLSYAKPLR